MYFETVDWATSNPSIKSSPWILDAPHSGFSSLIRPDKIAQAHDRSSAALPYFGISSARKL